MKVKIIDWRNEPIEIELAEALQPVSHADSTGAAERAWDQAEANAEAIGKLAALLVEKGALSIKEAIEACDPWVKVVE